MKKARLTAPPSPIWLAPGLRLVPAPNPSPMTLRGTNTYLLGQRDVVVIDPGPKDAAHLNAIFAAMTPKEQIVAILVTHAHLDHSALTVDLAARSGAPVLAYGPAKAGLRRATTPLPPDLASDNGVDHTFRPDRCLNDGETVTFGAVTLTALWTPGHFANHMCFAWNGALFTGDLIMGWATTVISLPYGDLDGFRRSATRLAARKDRIYYPGHGDPVTNPQVRTRALLAHRDAREAEILRALTRGPRDIATLTAEIYDQIPPNLIPAAQRNVLAHLFDLTSKNIVGHDEPLDFTTKFRLTGRGKNFVKK